MSAMEITVPVDGATPEICLTRANEKIAGIDPGKGNEWVASRVDLDSDTVLGYVNYLQGRVIYIRSKRAFRR